MIKINYIVLIIGGLLTSTPSLSGETKTKEISFSSIDGVKLFADIHTMENARDKQTILLFHQGGGDARGEYASIWPILLEEGFNVMAVDIRGGGNRLGGVNRTVEALGEAQYEYCDVQPDISASIEAAKNEDLEGPYILWGSSFSAALVINESFSNTENVLATLAFSPASGGPLAACSPNQHAGNLKKPLMLLRPNGEMEIESVQAQFKLFKDAGHTTFVSEGGVHGSSMLNPERVEKSSAPTWAAVKGFLNQLKK